MTMCYYVTYMDELGNRDAMWFYSRDVMCEFMADPHFELLSVTRTDIV